MTVSARAILADLQLVVIPFEVKFLATSFEGLGLPL